MRTKKESEKDERWNEKSHRKIYENVYGPTHTHTCSIVHARFAQIAFVKQTKKVIFNLWRQSV